MCSRDVNTIFPMATMPSLRIASLTNFTVGGDVIRAIQVEFIDLVPGHELIDVDCALALDCDGFQFLGVDLDVLILADLVPLDDVGRLDLIPGLRINPAVLDAVARTLVELMEADLLSL